MPWILLTASLIIPPAIILSPPWRMLSPTAFRIRLASAIIIVWAAAIAWSLVPTESESDADDWQVTERNFSDGPREKDPKKKHKEEESSGKNSSKSRKVTAASPKQAIVAKPAPASRPADDEAPVPTVTTTRPSAAIKEGSDGDKDIEFEWWANSRRNTGMILLLGWMPGLAYAGLLFLARRGLQGKQVELTGEVIDPRQFRRPY
jgi:hypothetical protein